MGLLSLCGSRGAAGWLAGGILLFSTVFSLSAQDDYDTAWIDADGGTYGNGSRDRDFTSLDDVLYAIQNENPDRYDPEVIIFAGENQHTYTWSTYVDETPGTVVFTSLTDDPENYAVISHVGSESSYNFANGNNLTFEKVILTGSLEFELGQTDETHTFRKCIIRDFTGSNIFTRAGNNGGTTNFINCLFEGNTCDAIFDITFWQGENVPILNIINCTFDNNTAVWASDVESYTGITLVNCIFSGNETTFPGNNLRGRTTYSLTSETDISNYGTGCVSATDPDYLESSRSLPSHWRPLPSSPARNTGTSTGAPSEDLSNTDRIVEVAGNVDAGCWDILGIPSFTMNFPADTAVAAGGSLTLGVTVDGTEPMTFKWHAVGDPDTLSDSAELALSDLTIDNDSMKVYCLAANIEGTVSSDTVTIVVVEAPVITSQPEDIFGFAGDDADFSITATGKYISYAWYKDGTLKPAQTTSEYTSIDIEAADSGAAYVCIVSNIGGSATSDTAFLHVVPDRAIIQTASDDTTISEGVSITLRVTATGKPTLSYSWKEVGDGDELSDADTLRITDAEITDGTFYRCIVSNGDGEDSVDIKLVVLPGSAPVITGQSGTDIGSKAGKDIDLFVTAEGGGTFSYTWYKDGLSDDDEVGTGATLSLTSVEESDGGVYRCIVSNGFGSDTSLAITVSIVTSEIYNLLSLEAEFIDPTHARLRISNFSDLPASGSSPPYVDSIAVWYDDLTFPAGPFSTDDQKVFVFALADMISAGDEPFSTVVEFSQAPSSCIPRYFIAAPVWNDPDTIPATVTSAQRATVEMCASAKLPNSMVLTLDYKAVSDSVAVTVSNLTSLDRDSLMYLIIKYTFGENSTPDSVEMFTDGELPDASTDVFKRTFKDERLEGDEDSLFVSVLWRGVLGNFSSTVTKKVTVGNERPKNTAVLHIDTAGTTMVSLHWDAVNGDAIDSVRLWWGRLPLPDGADIDTGIYSSKTFPVNVTADTVDGLLSAQKYYFGLQVAKDNVWSLIPDEARETISTRSPYKDSISNTITLTDIRFESSTNEFTITWDVDTTGVAAIELLETGIVWAVNEAPGDDSLPNPVFGVIDSLLSVEDNSLTFDLDGNQQYLCTYHFALLLRRKGDIWAPATDASRGTVDISTPEQEEITYFIDNDTVTAFGEEVWFWKVGDGSVSITDTINFFMPDNPEGFMIVSRTGFDLVHDQPSDPIAVGLKYDSALVGTYPLSYIRMYQYDKSTALWYVINDITFDIEKRIVSTVIRPEDDSLPFILMIDTIAPEPSFLTDTSTVAVANEDVVDSVVIKDNVANTTVRLTFWRPDEEQDARTFKCSGTPDTVELTVPKDSLTELKSVRAFITVSDGVHSETIEISRKVRRSKADPIFADSMRWAPVFTTAELEDASVEVALKGLGEDGKWNYNKKFYRVFRWIDTAEVHDEKKTSYYVEYSRSINKLFSLEPGRVLWVKARGGIDITSLGSGTTVGMKKPFEIKCDGNSQWTDFALPYNFDITVGDILEATSEDQQIRENISVYRWVLDETDSLIYPRPKYLPRAIGFDSLAVSLTYKVGNDGVGSYSAFNRNNDYITLKIPAIPATFSRIKHNGTAKKWQRDGWTILVNAASEEGKLSPVCCGYSSYDDAVQTTYPVVPSFSKQHVAVVPPKTKETCGAVLFHESPEGGNVFPLEFANGNKRKTRITFNVEEVTQLPKNYQMALYSPTDGTINGISGKNSVTVAALAKEKRWLLVGDSAFISTWITRFSVNSTFKLLRIFPNPCRGALQIRFTLPYDDVHRMTINVFNQLGRRVWNSELNGAQLTAGENAIVWNPVTGHSRLAAGTYIIRMNIYNSKGWVIGSKMRRVLYLP